jgi:Cof subfamily protein (haloacid dehalogenase superfamily)
LNPAEPHIRLLAIDLDGTLWDHSLEFNKRDAGALRQAARRGIEVVPVSARPPFGIEYGLHGSDFYRYAIAFNGSLVYERATQQELLNLAIPPAQAHAAIDLIHKYHLYAGFYAGSDFYAEIDDENARLEAHSQGRHPVIVPDLSKFAGRGPNKLIVIELKDSQRLTNFYEEASQNLADLSLLYSTGYTIEICPSRVSKASGLRFLAERLGILPAEIMAVGDSYNDISMIELAGIGVAVANAPLEVRQAADWVTASCQEGGVARAVSRFILGSHPAIECV